MKEESIVKEQYLRCVAKAEDEVGEILHRFRGAVISFEGHNISTNQRPNYFHLPDLYASPFWSKNMLPMEVQEILNKHKINKNKLILECVDNIANMDVEKGRTAYHGNTSNWLRHDLVGRGGEILNHVEVAYPHWYKFLLELRERNYLSGTFFAKMQKNSELSLHSGAFNVAIRMHFGLLIPKGDLGIQVDKDLQRWKTGEWLFFDDTYPHKAWNHSSEDRWILLIRLLHPDLTDTERRAFYLMEKNPLFWETYNYFKDNFFIKN